MNRADRRARGKGRRPAQPEPPRLTAQCDKCGHRFSPRIREEPAADGGVVGLFACGSCATVYESYHLDAEGLVVRERLARVSSGTDEAKRLGRELKAHISQGRGRLDLP